MRELLQMALNALECHTQETRPIHNTELAIDALRAALAQPAEPVAWAMLRADGTVLDVICPDERAAYQGEYTVPLYAAPQAQPIDGFGGNLDSAFDWGTPHDASGAPWPDAAPAVREPLTDAQMTAIYRRVFGLVDSRPVGPQIDFIRAIERAHGITGDSK